MELAKYFSPLFHTLRISLLDPVQIKYNMGRCSSIVAFNYTSVLMQSFKNQRRFTCNEFSTRFCNNRQYEHSNWCQARLKSLHTQKRLFSINGKIAEGRS